MRPRILVSNDDGINAAGLAALVEAVSPLGEAWVVAPDREQSASSHALSLHRPLRLHEVKERWLAVDGTPADCAYIGINHVLKDQRPALVVSGINHGANLAEDVIYSGTVAAAMEAAILGVPAVAFSLVSRAPFDFTAAAGFARALVAALLERQLPKRMLLNVNVPGHAPPRGFRVARLGRHSYGAVVVENVDPRGRKYYWIGGSEYQHDDLPGSDCNAVMREGLISVTPMQLDLTDDRVLEGLRDLRIAGFERQDG